MIIINGEDIVLFLAIFIFIYCSIILLPFFISIIIDIYDYFRREVDKYRDKVNNINTYLSDFSHRIENLTPVTLDKESIFYLNYKGEVLLEYKKKDKILYISDKCTEGKITKHEYIAIKKKFNSVYNKRVKTTANINCRLTSHAEKEYNKKIKLWSQTKI